MDESVRDVLEREREILAARAEGVLAIDLTALGEGESDGAIHGAESARTISGPLAWTIEHPEHQAGISAGVAEGRYLEPVCPEGFTYIFGCGHVGRALAGVLTAAGFEVIACDTVRRCSKSTCYLVCTSAVWSTTTIYPRRVPSVA